MNKGENRKKRKIYKERMTENFVAQKKIQYLLRKKWGNSQN